MRIRRASNRLAATSSIARPVRFVRRHPPNNQDDNKNNSTPAPPDKCCGDPINVGTGNKYETKTEFRGSGPFPLEFTWIYNSRVASYSPYDNALGSNRRHSYARTLLGTGPTSTVAYLVRPNGNWERFTKPASAYLPDPGIVATLSTYTDTSGNTVWERRENGETEIYHADGKLVSWSNRAGLTQTLAYDASGNLTTVTDPMGRVLRFHYNASNLISSLDLPDGQTLTFTYDNTLGLIANLVRVDSSGGGSVSYLYNESGYVATPNWHVLTGVVDELGVRYSSTTYNASQQATSTYLAGGLDAVTAQYTNAAIDSTLSSTSVTLPSGLVDQRSYRVVYGRPRLTARTLSGAGIPTRTTSYTQDSTGQVDLETDPTGVVTDYDFDINQLLTKVIRAKGTPQEQVETRIWDTTQRVPTQIDVPGQRQSFAYNTRSQATATCLIDVGNATAMAYVCGSATNAPAGVRQSRITYCEAANVTAGTCPRVGLLTSVDGPRTDVTDVMSYSYYATDDSICTTAPTTCPHRKGDLWKVTNALGQVTENQAYDGAGRLLSIKDANGVITDLAYWPRGWLKSRKVRGIDNASETDDAITLLDYFPTGQVSKVTQPDAAYMVFTYDAAHRLTDVTDVLGNKVHYTLDNSGNRIMDETKDPGGVVKRSLSRVYDALGQLKTLADAYSTPTDFTYDLNGNLNTTTDPLLRVTDNDVDPFNRLIKVVANTGGTASDKATTQFTYDARDNLTVVNDPKGLNTSYVYNGLNDLTQLSSPDTGTTTYGVNAAGQRTSQTDARLKTTSYAYDVLGRLTTQTVPTTAQNVTFAYDTPATDCLVGETFGAGRLARITDESGSTRYCYDRRGNAVRKVQTVVGGTTLTTGTSFDAAGHISAMTYPSGAIVVYHRNLNGQIDGVDAVPLGGSNVTVVSAVSYLPLGPLSSLTFGTGPSARVLTKAYDLNYGIDAVSDSAASNPLSEDLTLNTVGNVAGLTERTNATTTLARTFTYDGLGRLTAQKNGATTVESFTYDATGDRQNKTGSAYTYPGTSHLLSSVGGTARTYDAIGNTTVIGNGGTAKKWSFDDRNRARDFKINNSLKANYRYNGQGERVLKIDAVNSANSEQFVYDEAGHLLGEYNTTTGARIKEYVWLDDTLVAVLSSFDGTTYQYVETDHLGTPRAVVQPTKNVIVWRWDLNNTAFGDHVPNFNPDGDSLNYTLNLRYPGQYADAESGLRYNYFRDYEPGTGRYIESDPIGLGGGASTYGYVGGNALRGIDPYGLEAVTMPGSTPFPISIPPWMTWAWDSGGAAVQAIGTAVTSSAGIAVTGVGALIYPSPIGVAPCEMPGSLGCSTHSIERERGLPPPGLAPPVAGACEVGPASRPSEADKGGKSLWDPDGGEWRYHPGDRWHNPHWDHNPWSNPNSPWGNVPIGDLPPVKPSPGE